MEDDVRQDAAMEQIFGLANTIFKRDENTRKRNLRVKTYQVIALGPQVGMLEFVVNSVCLGDWLIPAHKK